MKDLSSRHWYYIDGQGSYNNVLARESTKSVKFSVGQAIDDWDWQRGFFRDWDYWIAERWRRLRRDHGYIRLWFSGGKDSLLVLKSAIQHRIHIDEIVYVMMEQEFQRELFPQFSMNREIHLSAESYLQNVRHLLPRTKITKLLQTEDHFICKFSDPLWITQSAIYKYLINKTELLFYTKINPTFSLLADVEDRCDLVGAATPHVWFNEHSQCWEFCYDDRQMFNSMHDHGEDFFASSGCPELLNAVIENMVINLEKRNQRPSRFELGRDRRSLIDCYNFDLDDPASQVPKPTKSMPMPTEDWFWGQQDFKSFHTLINSYVLPKWPKSLEHYIHGVDWKFAQQSYEKGGMITKVWQMK